MEFIIYKFGVKFIKHKFVVLMLCLVFIFSLEEFSHPRFALRQKDSCINCHFNPTGGLIRTKDGFFFGKNVLSMISPRDKDITLSPKISDNIEIGLDYRTQFLYAQSIKRGDFQDMSGNLYVNVGIAPKINVTTRYDFVESIWEAYATASILPNDSFVKVGTFTPDYGIRLDDHTAYTRGGDFALITPGRAPNGLIFSPYYTETGVEVGANFTDAVTLTASVGRDKLNTIFLNDPAVMSRLQVTPKLDSRLGLMFGGSFASYTTRSAGNRLRTMMYGGFAGIGYDRFSLLGEFDVANDYQGAGV